MIVKSIFLMHRHQSELVVKIITHSLAISAVSTCHKWTTTGQLFNPTLRYRVVLAPHVQNLLAHSFGFCCVHLEDPDQLYLDFHDTWSRRALIPRWGYTSCAGNTSLRASANLTVRWTLPNREMLPKKCTIALREKTWTPSSSVPS
jgi:hypothetical protein